jgi:phage-related protein
MVSDNLVNIIIKIQDEASKVSQKVEEQMSKLGDTSRNAMNIWSRAAEQVSQSMDTVHKALDRTREKFQTLKNKGADAFNMIKNGVNSAATSFNNLISKSNTATLMMEKIKSVGERVKNTLNTIKLPSSLQSSISSVTQKFETLTGYAGNAAESIKNHFTSAASALSQKFETASNSIKNHFESLKGHAQILGNQINTTLGSAFDKLIPKVVKVADTIKTKLSNAVKGVQSKVNSLSQSFSGLGGIISSALGAIGMASIGQLTVGLAMTRERMRELTKATMGSAEAAQHLVDDVWDPMTNNSLVSLNDLGQAMNTIKMSTGMTNEQLENFSYLVNDVGQRAILMGKDSTEAMTIMQAAGRGLNGEFEILQTNFGITKDRLTELGWSGAADDVEGYTKAIEKYLEKSGNLEAMMATTTGKIKQVEKGFTSAGRQIGEGFIPYINDALDYMIDLKEKCPAVYKYLIMVAGAVSGFATLAPTILPMLNTWKALATIIGVSQVELLAIVGIAIAVAIAIFEIGKSFGWWNNVVEMIDAIVGGLQKIFDEISRSTEMESFIQALINAWDNFYSAISTVGIAITDAIEAITGSKEPIDLVTSSIEFLKSAFKIAADIINGVVYALQRLWDEGSHSQELQWVIQALSGAWDALRDAADRVLNSLSPLFKEIDNGNAGSALLTVAVMLLKGGLTFLAATITHVSIIIRFLGIVISNTITIITIIIQVLSSVVSFINGTLGNAIRGIIALLSGDTQGALQYFTSAWNTLMDALGPVGDFIMAVFAPAWQLVLDIVTPLFNLFMQLATIFSQLITGQISLQQALAWAWAAIQSTISTILSNVINRVVSWAQSMWNNAVNTGRNFLTGVVQFIRQLPDKIKMYLLAVAVRVITAGAQWVSNAKTKASQVVSGVMSWIKQLPQKVYQEFMNIGSRILSAGSQLVEKAKQIGKKIVDGMLSAMGIHSPGTIQESVVLEFVNMITRVKDQARSAGEAVKNVAQNMIDSYKKQNLDKELTAPDLVNAQGGFLGDPLVGTALDEYDTTHIGQEMDVTPTMNMGENNQIMDNYALMGQNVTGIFDLMSTDSTNALNSLTSANTLAYDTISATEQQKMNFMSNHIRNSMNQILLNTRMGMNNALNTTRTSLTNMQNSTTRTTQAMTRAWNTMKTSIIAAANKIKTDATAHFNKLSSTIGTFYRKLQNPSNWGAGGGTGTPSSVRRVGHRTGTMKKIRDIMREEKLPSAMTYYQARNSAYNNPAIGDYIIRDSTTGKIPTADLIRSKLEGAAGSWGDTVAPNVNHIKKTAGKWDMKGPAIKTGAGIAQTGLAFKVRDFETGTPNISFDSFVKMAEAVFSIVPYDHYYDSEKYGSWQNAIAAGKCNCSDGADALLALAATCGFSGSKVHGYWGKEGHFWTEINGKHMDTTAFQKGYGWSSPKTHAGPSSVGHRAGRASPNSLLEDFDVVKELNKNNNESNKTETNEENQIIIVLSGETKLKHEFIDLPDNISEEEIVRLINEAPEDAGWLKSLVQNMDFQELDRKIKSKLQFRENRANGV